jgi:hypothetical protein
MRLERNILNKDLKYSLAFFIILLIISCKQPTTPATNTLFQKLAPDQTGIHFSNNLNYDAEFNIYTYRNFYNGGGVAIGDVNNDGLPDVFFTANMMPNKLYLNKGNFKFEDITDKVKIGKKGKWSTGVSMADVNGDGWLDIYVCNSGDIKGDNRENELYINNGISKDGSISFTEKAKEFGLDERGLSTHAAFFDFDLDGDLDMFLLNNSFKAIGSFNLKQNERNIRDSMGGHKFYRNDGNYFKDISEEAGIYGSVIGFGLGVTVGDVNNDGWQDIYVSNDFFERDYLYINQHYGSFKERLENEMMSISNASMGADMADINNDARPDIFVTEMLPDDEGRIKTNITYQNWDKYQLDLKHDYYHQFTRNMLQLNNGASFEKNSTDQNLKSTEVSFSEIGRFAGVHATDWSWGALITDLDNNGWKDIFVANGIYQDLINQDYIQYISNESFFKEIKSGSADYKKMIDLIPSEPISNYAFSNNGDLTFTNRALEWGLDEPSFSNGSAYGDLDNDGDLDLVVNNVNMPCFVYRNESSEKYPENKYLKLTLKGEGKNTSAIGAKVTVYYNGTLLYQEQMPMRGFESTVDSRLNFGLGRTEKIDSVIVQWPGGRVSVLEGVKPNQHIVVKQAEAGRPLTGNRSPVTGNTLFTQTKDNYGIDFIHKENEFVDFDRDRMIFHMLSTQGPRMARGDVNADGLEDLYICGASAEPGALYEQTKGGRFKRTNEALLQVDSLSEDTDALFFDCDGDGDQDLYVCSGGNEFSPNSTALIDRLYINNGRGGFTRSPQVLPSYIFESTSCARAADYDRDGDLDLFVGVRLKPFSYGYPCKSYILQNNGKGIFTDVTQAVAPGLLKAGMVCDGRWLDYDGDGREDLVVAGEYMPISLYHNEGGRLKEVTSEAGFGRTNGWWNRIAVADINGDGYLDIIGANHGLNSRFKASEQKPVSMYVSDFDNNGTAEQVLTCYNGDSSYPMLLRHDLVSVLPYLKKKYLRYEDYKNQTVRDIFTAGQLSSAIELNAYTMQSSVFINNGKGAFTRKTLPVEAQLSGMYGIAVSDFDRDGKMDILMGGNFYQSKPEVGIYDASYGCLLKGDGKGGFVAVTPQRSGVMIRGAVRDIMVLQRGKNKIVVIAKNNEEVEIIQ